VSVPIARAALHTHPEPPASATAGADLQTPRRAAYLQSAAAVCIFAGDRVRLGDEHPGPSDDATKKIDCREKICLLNGTLCKLTMPQNVWYQFNFPTKKLV
jgi:hypothetical protein